MTTIIDCPCQCPPPRAVDLLNLIVDQKEAKREAEAAYQASRCKSEPQNRPTIEELARYDGGVTWGL